MPDLKRNILNSGYGINSKYEGMLSHSFYRFCMVAKFELPKVEDLGLQQLNLILDVTIWLVIVLTRTVIFQNL